MIFLILHVASAKLFVNMEENKKTKQIVLNVKEDMVDLVKLVLHRIRGVVSFND